MAKPDKKPVRGENPAELVTCDVCDTARWRPDPCACCDETGRRRTP